MQQALAVAFMFLLYPSEHERDLCSVHFDTALYRRTLLELLNPGLFQHPLLTETTLNPKPMSTSEDETLPLEDSLRGLEGLDVGLGL